MVRVTVTVMIRVRVGVRVRVIGIKHKGDKVKKIIETKDVEGLEKLMGERVTLYCQIYIYTGKLVGVNDSYVLLEDAGVVYETGAYDKTDWGDMQKLPHDWYVMKNAIESFGLLK